MTTSEFISAMKAEIEKLQAAVAILEGTRHGRRPKAQPAGEEPEPRKYHLTDEGRQRILDAQKRRWARSNRRSGA